MARRQARRSNQGAGPGLYFGAGVVTGLALATGIWLFIGLPGGEETQPAGPSGRDEPAIADEGEASSSREYEFFSVLPEIEVVVPREEIEERARGASGESAAGNGPYTLQAGSFRSGEDAEALRASIVLLGLDAEVQPVTVNDATWHRVRLGPFDSARDAERARRRLQDNGLEAMVLEDG